MKKNRRLIILDVIQIIGISISGFASSISVVFALFPNCAVKIGEQVMPFIEHISRTGWIIIAILWFIILLIFNTIIVLKKRKEIFAVFPNILLKRFDIDNVTPKIDTYGANSLLGSQAKNFKYPFYLLYLDFINDPVVHANNNACDVQVRLEYYDEHNESVKWHYGRWIELPEKECGIIHHYTNIPSDGETIRRLGIAYVDYGSGYDFMLLDSDEIDKHADLIYPVWLPEGKYTLLATVSGSNFDSFETVLFEIESRKNKSYPVFVKKENGKKWLKELKRKKRKVLSGNKSRLPAPVDGATAPQLSQSVGWLL